MFENNQTQSSKDNDDIIKQPYWKVKWELFKNNFFKNWNIFCENKIGIIGLIIIAMFVIIGILHPLLMWYWSGQDVLNVYHPIQGVYLSSDQNSLPTEHPVAPGLRTPLGTDNMGRDVLSQIMYSTRIEFIFGVLSALLGVVIATLVGTFAAYFGGKIDTFFMRFADLVLTFPFLAFLIFLSSMIKLNLITLGIVIGLINGFGGTTIVLKSQALSIKVKPYIEAAKISGGSHLHIIFKHILPNILPLSFLYLMRGVTTAVMSEATLSFLGLLNAPISWGLIIEFARSFGYSFYEAWWLYLAPGLAITLFCGAFYLIGRGLDPIVNPELRER